MKSNRWIDLLLAVGAVWMLFGGKLPATIAPVKATAATYIYEKDTTTIPVPVLSALNKLNRERKIVATAFEQDTVDGSGETPEQYKIPLAAAKEAGLPSLVVTADKAVLAVVKSPATEEAVIGAVP